jgi:hypothetical protein
MAIGFMADPPAMVQIGTSPLSDNPDKNRLNPDTGFIITAIGEQQSVMRFNPSRFVRRERRRGGSQHSCGNR